MNKRTKVLLSALLAVLLAGGGVVVGASWSRWSGKDQAPVPRQEENKADIQEQAQVGRPRAEGKNAGTIDIPGYGSISLKAGTAVQSVKLYNPEQNNCYFRMTLLLSDGAQLWQSELVEPGREIYELELTKALEAGVYEDSILKYECFAMDEARTPLNGSEIKLTLNVLE